MTDSLLNMTSDNDFDQIKQGARDAGITMSKPPAIPGRRTEKEDSILSNEASNYLSSQFRDENNKRINEIIYNWPHKFHHATQLGESRRQALLGILEDMQSKIKCQLCTLFLMDGNDGIFRCEGFYGLDKAGNPIPIYHEWLNDEHYSQADLSHNAAQAIKSPGSESLYGDIIILTKDKFHRANLLEIEEICGQIDFAILVPINGPNRSYGILRALYKVKSDDNPKDQLPVKDLVYLGMTSPAISCVIRDYKRKYEQELLLVMQDYQMSWEQHKQQAKNGNYGCIKAILSNVTKHLTSGSDGLVKSATLRLVYQKTQAICVSHCTQKDQGRKDNLHRDLKDQDCILTKVIGDGSDLLIPNVTQHSYFSRFKNKKWIKDNEFRDFFCLSLNHKGICIGMLCLYTSKYQILSIEDRRFLRSIANCLALYISMIFTSIKTDVIKQDFLDSEDLDKFLKNVSCNKLEKQLESKSIYISAAINDRAFVNDLKNQIVEKGMPVATSLDDDDANDCFSFGSTNSLHNSNIVLVLVSSHSLEDVLHQQRDWSEICMMKWSHNNTFIIPIQMDDAPLPQFLNSIPVIQFFSHMSASELLAKVFNYIYDLENASDDISHKNLSPDDRHQAFSDFVNSIPSSF